MEYYLSAWQKYATFSGRARRAEYWYFQLFNFLAITGLVILALSLDMIAIVVMYVLAVVLPSIAVTVRRLHDIDFSGWWILLNFVPLGGLIVFIFTVMPGTKGPNRFGADPITGAVASAIPSPVATATATTAPTATPEAPAVTESNTDTQA